MQSCRGYHNSTVTDTIEETNRDPSILLPSYCPRQHHDPFCEPLLPLVVLSPVTHGFSVAVIVVPAPGLTAEAPGLAAWSDDWNASNLCVNAPKPNKRIVPWRVSDIVGSSLADDLM
jgi:hypothetical protein